MKNELSIVFSLQLDNIVDSLKLCLLAFSKQFFEIENKNRNSCKHNICICQREFFNFGNMIGYESDCDDSPPRRLLECQSFHNLVRYANIDLIKLEFERNEI